jgi:hypothetical protein
VYGVWAGVFTGFVTRGNGLHFFYFLFLFLFFIFLFFFFQQEKVAFGRMIGGAIEADMYV